MPCPARTRLRSIRINVRPSVSLTAEPVDQRGFGISIDEAVMLDDDEICRVMALLPIGKGGEDLVGFSIDEARLRLRCKVYSHACGIRTNHGTPWDKSQRRLSPSALTVWASVQVLREAIENAKGAGLRLLHEARLGSMSAMSIFQQLRDVLRPYCPHSNLSEGEHFTPIPFTIVVPFWWPVTPGMMANWRFPAVSDFALIGCFSP